MRATGFMTTIISLQVRDLALAKTPSTPSFPHSAPCGVTVLPCATNMHGAGLKRALSTNRI